MRTFHFYIDDSGTRHPDHFGGIKNAERDWFALGGVIIEECDEKYTRDQVGDFRKRWSIAAPLHSYPIRRRKDAFAWLNADRTRAEQFMQELTDLLVTAPIIGHGCVIDRTGYNERYTKVYGRDKWSLCKTAFSIAVERAAKYAIANNGRLRVFVERSTRKEEQKLKSYYEELRSSGNPFDAQRSSSYQPLGHGDLSGALFEFRPKYKESPIMQLADLYLHPICMGGYDKDHLPFRILSENRKLIDQHLDPADIQKLGIKYSCFRNDAPKTQKPENLSTLEPLAATYHM